MPSTRSGGSYNPSSRSQKGYRNYRCRCHSASEAQGSLNKAQNDKLYHSEADNTALPSNRAYTSTRSLSGHLQIQPEGLQRFTKAQRLSNPFRSVRKLNELLPDCEKIFGPSQYLQVTQWVASIDVKEKYDPFNQRME
ncbi:hypothetical protein O181_011310 [Austropuccinia psidii MF-1]|uniref:Uncharacterized protein n=1 Tax=Austropuccinia psidii MF-1 TaxID=1389203 RepID=A0A9Q3GLS6_9BASI|nr:hypothetical protein [Austropuccinia psidii MF-1]